MPVNLTILLGPLVAFVYVFSQGVDRFFTEAYGTLLLSPTIYLRILPESVSNVLLPFFASSNLLCLALCAVPMGMLVLAVWLSVFAFKNRSMPSALLSLFLIVLVFGVYHSVKHLGFSVVS
ncbi:MAG: hypothetical protein ACK5LK_08795 [Chthoniobacterales bacterium]